MERSAFEWSFGKDRDLVVEVWSTAALIAAVIEALLEDPEKLRLALKALGAPRTGTGRADAAAA